jgi:hypothetical protein
MQIHLITIGKVMLYIMLRQQLLIISYLKRCLIVEVEKATIFRILDIRKDKKRLLVHLLG